MSLSRFLSRSLPVERLLDPEEPGAAGGGGEGRRRVPQLKWRWQERGLAPGGPRIFLREEEEPGGGLLPHQPTLTNTTPDPAPINYRGWMVVLASFLCVAIVDGVGYTTGLMLESLKSELGGSRGAVAVVGSLQVGVYSLSGPIVGKLVSRFGPRAVCISGAIVASCGLLASSFAPSLTMVYSSYGLITGFGFGAMYLPSVVGVAPFFTENRALAIGICLCGSGVGTFGLAPVSNFILLRHGWRWVMRMFSGLCLLCTFCGALMATDLRGPTGAAEEEQDAADKRGEEEDGGDKGPEPHLLLQLALGKELARSNRLLTFLLFSLSDFLAFVAIYIPYTYLPPLAIAHNILPGDAAFLISAGGISNTLGRILGGWLSDKHWAPKPLHLSLVAIAAAALPSFVLPNCLVYWTFLASFGFFGLVTGSLVGCTSPVLVSLLGLPALSPAFGLVTAFRGVAALLGPPSAGMLVDRFDNHGLALYLTGGLLLSSTVIEIFASVANLLHQRRNGYTQLS